MKMQFKIGRMVRLVLCSMALAAAAAMPVGASNCRQTSVNRTPINDLGTGLYLGQFQGGLYPDGSNQVPAAHAAVGAARAAAVQPLTPAGLPNPNGRYVMLSIGMSNTTQEFCSQGSGLPCDAWTFMGQATVDPLVNHATLRLVNGAAGGQTSSTWDSPTDQNYDRVRDTRLVPQGLSEAQVQAVWIKVANAGPTVSLPGPGADAREMVGQMGNIVRAVKVRYPNMKVAFLSSRIYAGYASTTLNPEPYAYESGFAVKWLIEAQIRQMAGGPVDPLAGNLNYDTVAPWIAWGPYLWTDGLVPRSDGLIWECIDTQSDGTHPSMTGEEKVADMLMDFMLTSPFATPWFRADGGSGSPADLNGDGIVNSLDLGILLSSWSVPPTAPGCGGSSPCPADLNHDGRVNSLDLGMLLAAWTV